MQKTPFDAALDFENRATRAPLSCRNASYLHKGAGLIGRPWKFVPQPSRVAHGRLAHVPLGLFRGVGIARKTNLSALSRKSCRCRFRLREDVRTTGCTHG